jgi:hypothetical protein
MRCRRRRSTGRPAARGRFLVVLRRSARDLARRTHVHGLDLHDGQRLGGPLHRQREAHQACDLQGPGAGRSQQPFTRVPARRTHHRVLLPPLRSPPSSSRHPQRDAVQVSLGPYSIDGFGGVRTVPPTSRAASGTPVRTRCSSRTTCGSSGEAVPGTRRSPTPRTASAGCRPESSSTSATHSCRTPSTWETGTAGSMPSSPTATRRTGRTACTTCATRPRACMPPGDAASGRCAPCHCTRRSSTTSTVTRTEGGAPGPRHRAHRGGPPTGRLHAPGGQPRHLLLRVPQRHEVGQPQNRRGGSRHGLLPFRWRDSRPRGSAHRLPVADGRAPEPGGAVVHSGRRPHVVDAPPHL